VPAPSSSLEDYFDRLDAAFASLEGGAPADATLTQRPPLPPQPPHPISHAPATFAEQDAIGGWDPDLTVTPSRPAAVQPPRVDVAPNQVAAAPPAAQPPAQPAPPLPMPSLAEAFAALLSAEQSRPIAPSAIGGPAQIGDEIIEEVVRRVIARMGDSVLDAAERLVKEEIERIKRG
jgi:hypothetical protein